MPKRTTVERARKLRRSMTPPEVRLWQYLRTTPHGIKFRRQHPIGDYVLDFYCAVAKLAVEVDGIAHDMGRNPERDVKRDAWLLEQGIDVLRIAVKDVTQDFEAVVATIFGRCALPLHHASHGPPPHPSDREE